MPVLYIPCELPEVLYDLYPLAASEHRSFVSHKTTSRLRVEHVRHGLTLLLNNSSFSLRRCDDRVMSRVVSTKILLESTHCLGGFDGDVDQPPVFTFLDVLEYSD